MSIIDITTKRGFQVVKSNHIIQKIIIRKRELKTQEQKAISYIISKIQEGDINKDSHIYDFDLKEFCEICGINTKSGWNKEAIKSALENIASNGFWIKTYSIKTKKPKETYFQWITTPEIIDDNLIRVQIPNAIFVYLDGLKEYFTTYELYKILPLKSAYSIALYELMKSYEYKKEPIELSLDELKRNLGVINSENENNVDEQPYKEFRDFKRRVLNVAQSEINKYTDINVEWEGISIGRRYVGVRFNVRKKDFDERYVAYNETKKVIH